MAMHISLGTYHGAVVVDDVSTNYPFESLNTFQMEILNGLKEHCFVVWKELERAKFEDVKVIKKQLKDIHDRFERAKQKDSEMTRRGTSLKARALMKNLAKASHAHDHNHAVDE